MSESKITPYTVILALYMRRRVTALVLRSFARFKSPASVKHLCRYASPLHPEPETVVSGSQDQTDCERMSSTDIKPHRFKQKFRTADHTNNSRKAVTFVAQFRPTPQHRS